MKSKYCCVFCDNAFDSRKLAVECCSESKYDKMYECDMCGCLHEDSRKAGRCCTSTATGFYSEKGNELYACSICKTVYNHKDDADMCCYDKEVTK